MLIFTIVMSLTMLGMGLYLGKGGPSNINSYLGYRTKRSMSSQESWKFAQKQAGKVYKVLAIINFIIFGFVYLLIKNTGNYKDIFLICAYIEIAMLLIAVPIVEIKLKNFLKK